MTSPTPDLLTAALKARDADLVKRLQSRAAFKTYRTKDDGTELYWLDRQDTDPMCIEAAQAIIDMAGRLEKAEAVLKTIAELPVRDNGGTPTKIAQEFMNGWAVNYARSLPLPEDGA